MHILLVGGTGLMGTRLCEYFLSNNARITVWTRRAVYQGVSRPEYRFITDLKEVDASYSIIINLAGEPLDKKRWKKSVKKTIYESRIQMTQQVIEYIKKTTLKPKLLINGSAIGFYGAHIEKTFTEDSILARDTFTH